MSFSASRLTCYALLSAVESDLREIILEHLASTIERGDLFGNDLRDRCILRFEKDAGSTGGDPAAEDLLPYADFGDLFRLLNAHASELPATIALRLKALTSRLEQLTAIRNRVAHSRPLDFADLPAVLDFTRDVARDGDPTWQNTRETLARLDHEPSFVLGLSIPTDDTEIGISHNLPTPDFDETGFIGRKHQVAQLLTLSRGPYPVITIVGDGGLGKTALALKAAYDTLDSPDCPFEAIVWTSSKTTQLTVGEIRSIEGAIRDSLGVFTTLARHLAGDNDEDPLEEVLRYLATFKLLLVLDNLETVLDDRVRAFLERLPAGSKVLITSRIGIGAYEYPVKLQPMDASDATHLLRALAKVRSVQALERLPTAQLAAYCARMKHNPGYIKWFVSAVQAGSRPEDVLAHSDIFLEFCMSNVYDYLSLPSRRVLRAMLCLPEPQAQAELHFLTGMAGIDLQRALQQLLTTNMVVMTSVPRGASSESYYEVSELARNYLTKQHPILPEEFRELSGRKRELVAENEQIRAESRTDPYSPFSIAADTRSDLVVARYLRDALRAGRTGRFDDAEKLLAEARELAPGYHEVRRVEAWVKARAGNISAARAAYEAAIELEPDRAPLHIWFGFFLLDKFGDAEGALREFERAKRLDPGSYDVQLALARAFLETGDLAGARRILDALIGASNLTSMHRRRVYDLHLHYFQKQAERLASQHDDEGAITCLKQLREAYEACSADLRSDSMLPILRRAVRTAERCGDHMPHSETKRQASELAWWLHRTARPRAKTRLREGDEYKGHIARLVRQRGFGFITVDAGTDVFFHRDDLAAAQQWDDLSIGDRVSFVVHADPRGWRASRVCLLA